MPNAKSRALATVAPVMSSDDIRARLASLVSSDPAIAQAIALASLQRGRGAAAPRATGANESEAERACRCAQFTGNSARVRILSFCINKLGKKDSVTVTEDELSKAIGLPVYKVRPALSIVQDRLSDLHNALFPLVSQIGYTIAVAGERNEAKTATFSRVAPVAPVAQKRVQKARKSPSAPVAKDEGEKTA